MQEAGFARYPQLEPNSKSMMKTKLTLFVTVLAVALFGVGCATTEPAFVSDGLVAYYPFNGNAKDESGNGDDGEVDGAVLTNDRHGNENSAYSFGGEKSIIVKDIAFDSRYTLSVWFRAKSSESMMILAMQRSDSNRHSHAFIQHNAKGVAEHPNGLRAGNRMPASQGFGKNIYNDKNLHDGSWHHATAVKSGGKFSLFIDGILASEIKDGQKRDTVAANLHIGENFSNNYYDGSIDEVRIYNRALSAEEVKALYDLEKPKGK
jgi:hypothetical protein